MSSGRYPTPMKKSAALKGFILRSKREAIWCHRILAQHQASPLPQAFPASIGGLHVSAGREALAPQGAAHSNC